MLDNIPKCPVCSSECRVCAGAAVMKKVIAARDTLREAYGDDVDLDDAVEACLAALDDAVEG